MEKQLKKITAILPPPAFHMVGDGFRVHNFFPSHPEISSSQTDPFFLMDYGSKWNVPPSERPRGVGVHPHRGFETVTIAYHGRVAHHDSAGNSGVIYEGDVQWMTAGSGVLHKEYHEKEFSKNGGTFQMVQIWLNLPSKYKMTPPKYQAIENKNMPRFLLDDNKGQIEIIAGEYKTLKGPASTFSPVTMLNTRLSKGALAEFRFNETCNTGMLVVEGEIKINSSEVAQEDHFVLFGNIGEDIVIEAIRDCTVLVLSGKPINEPIAASGPFVMNTEAEIKQAYQDFRSGKFGYLEE
jgi:quercetin 2,3-dioxygenase